jgi:V/A-type H+/Na+-transporting ATPase subunit F
MEVKIAAFGEKDIMLIFKAIGADVYQVDRSDNMEYAEGKLKQLIKEGYGIIFMTETIAEKMDSIVKYYSNRVSPSIVIIPGPGERNNYAVRQLRSAIIRAVGADVMAEGENKK